LCCVKHVSIFLLHCQTSQWNENICACRLALMVNRGKLKVQQLHRIICHAVILDFLYLFHANLLEVIGHAVLLCFLNILVPSYLVCDQWVTCMIFFSICAHFRLVSPTCFSNLRDMVKTFSWTYCLCLNSTHYCYYYFSYHPGLPSCLSLDFSGSMVEGGRLSFNAAYSGGWDPCANHVFFLWWRLIYLFVHDLLTCFPILVKEEVAAMNGFEWNIMVQRTN